jgi:hypothetical protein
LAKTEIRAGRSGEPTWFIDPLPYKLDRLKCAGVVDSCDACNQAALKHNEAVTTVSGQCAGPASELCTLRKLRTSQLRWLERADLQAQQQARTWPHGGVTPNCKPRLWQLLQATAQVALAVRQRPVA